jgi:DNA (cytosine-5)-methyltransferase 1
MAKSLKILNLYAGIGGNRKLWGDEHDITAVEINEQVAAVYCKHFPNDKMIIGDAHQYLLDHYHEFDFIWSSPPCQSHSRARLWGFRNSKKVEKKYPDLALYQEIIFLDNYYDGLWVVENVKPYYEPLIKASRELGRHLFWSNFYIRATHIKEADINRGTQKELSELHGFDLSAHKISTRKDQIYRNCVHPETGLMILNCAQGIIENNSEQLSFL